VKKATSASSLKAINLRLVRVSLVTLAGGAPLGRLPCAASSMPVSWPEGLAMLGNPFDRGNLKGAAETTDERHERPAREATRIECILIIF
jgi:hypothetical protein